MADQTPPDRSVPEDLLDRLITKGLVEEFEDAETLARVRHGAAGLRGWDLRLAEVKDALRATASRFYAAGVAAGRAQAAADIRREADDEAQRPHRDRTSKVIEKWLRVAAHIAEGHTECLDKENTDA